MKYEYSKSSLESLSEFSQDIAEKIQDLIDEAAKDDFFNHETYSFVYDNHGTSWDKLDFKKQDLNHRIFFSKIGGKVFILEIIDRDNFEYSPGLYHELENLDSEIRNNR